MKAPINSASGVSWRWRTQTTWPPTGLLARLGFRFEGMVIMPGESEEIRQYAIEPG